jgi:hypothetical protein
MGYFQLSFLKIFQRLENRYCHFLSHKGLPLQNGYLLRIVTSKFCTLLRKTRGSTNSNSENPLKPAEFQVFRKDNLACRPACHFWAIPLGNRYLCFDKAVGFEGMTREALANRNQLLGQLIRFRSKEAF